MASARKRMALGSGNTATAASAKYQQRISGSNHGKACINDVAIA